MKKIVFAFAFLVTFVAQPFAQQAVTDTVRPVTTDIPDQIPVVVGTDTFVLPAKDVRVVIDTIKSFNQEHEGNWPKTPIGWLGLIAVAIFSGKFTQATTSAKNIYNWLKPLLKKTLFIVALIAGVVSAGITYGLAYLNKGEFDYVQFSLIWSVVINIGVFIYETWIKPKKETPPVVAEPTVQGE